MSLTTPIAGEPQESRIAVQGPVSDIAPCSRPQGLSLRRTKATLIARRTGNLRAVQLPLWHNKIDGTVRYLGIEVDGVLAMAEQVDV